MLYTLFFYILLPWLRLKLLFLSSEKQEELINSRVPKEAVTYFEYKKLEKRYWTKKHLLDQIVKNALPIGKPYIQVIPYYFCLIRL